MAFNIKLRFRQLCAIQKLIIVLADFSDFLAMLTKVLRVIRSEHLSLLYASKIDAYFGITTTLLTSLENLPFSTPRVLAASLGDTLKSSK